jgi:hypothetical protein
MAKALPRSSSREHLDPIYRGSFTLNQKHDLPAWYGPSVL